MDVWEKVRRNTLKDTHQTEDRQGFEHTVPKKQRPLVGSGGRSVRTQGKGVRSAEQAHLLVYCLPQRFGPRPRILFQDGRSCSSKEVPPTFRLYIKLRTYLVPFLFRLSRGERTPPIRRRPRETRQGKHSVTHSIVGETTRRIKVMGLEDYSPLDQNSAPDPTLPCLHTWWTTRKWTWRTFAALA